MFWMKGFPYIFLIFGSLIKLLLFVGLIVLLVLVIRALSRTTSPQKTQPVSSSAPDIDPAFEILRERYARGEIDKDQFEDMRRNLGA